MAPTVGFLAVIKTSGTSTAMVAEATTDVGGAHTTYQITDTAKRVLDPATAVVVDKDGVPAAAADYTLDYFTGTVTFAVALGAGVVVTFDASYLPLLEVATARDVSLSLARERLDKTAYQTSQYRQFTLGVGTCEGSLELLEFGEVDHDPGAGVVKFTTLIDGTTPVLLEIAPATTGNRLRCWALLTAAGRKSPHDDLTSLSLSFAAAGNAPAAPYSWAA